jgi:hypothetical protein
LRHGRRLVEEKALHFDRFRARRPCSAYGLASSVAGKPCALWRRQGYLGRSGTVSTTSEGVILELMPDDRPTPLFQTLSITFARQGPRWFAIPADYQIAALPGTGGVPSALTPR